MPLQNYRKRTRCLILVLFLLFAAGLIPQSMQPQTVTPPTVFEVELPDFQLPPSSQPEITIPSPSVSQLFVHVLKPAADGIDYGLIRTSLNGQAAAPISDVVNGARGKVVKLDLNRFPGFEFVTGRNTVEVWAQNRRGRTFYSSFVIKTVNSSWNEDFTYETQVGAGSKMSPPRVVLLEPQRAVELSLAKKTMTVRINGIATSEGEITRVAVDGKNVQFKLELKAASRQLTRVSDSERSVTFETIHSVQSSQTQIVMEVEDRAGSRTRVLIPVVSVKNKVATPVSGKKYALIIGISKYRNNLRGIANLEFADADAKSIYEFLQKPAAGGFAREDMLYLTNEQATNARIRDALTNFVSKPGTEDLLLIFLRVTVRRIPSGLRISTLSRTILISTTCPVLQSR